MDIDEIRAFVAIVQLGGFTRAADQLRRSQPAVSRRISLFEQEVGAERLLVICSPDHPAAGKRLKPSQLKGERWVAFPATGGRESLGKILERQLIAAGLDEAKITVIDSLTAQKRMVEAGFGIALVPASSVRDELKLGTLRELDVPGLRTTVPVVLVHRRKGYLNPAARALIALIGDAAPHLVRRSKVAR